MKVNKSSVGSIATRKPDSLSEVVETEDTSHYSWLSHQLLAHYKLKSTKLEQNYDELLEMISNIKSACDFTNELQLELRLRNEELSKLQQLISDIQVHLFQEREENLRLIAENDRLTIQDCESRKKINLLLMINGATEAKFSKFMASNVQGVLVEPKLPPRLQKLKERVKQRNMTKMLPPSDAGCTLEKCHHQAQMFNLELIISQSEEQIKVCKQQIQVLFEEKNIMAEEKAIQIERFQKEIDSLGAKLKECQTKLLDTSEKLVRCENNSEKNNTQWMNEKAKYLKTIHSLKIKLGEDVQDVFDWDTCLGSSLSRCCSENEVMRQKIVEKERQAASYKEKVLTLENEIKKVREREETCRQAFKEKTEKMRTHLSYLKNKYEDLNRRRLLEAEGFRTDIRMLRERLKILEKKFEKVSNGPVREHREQQQLLVSARNTLCRAKLLERELGSMKLKIHALEANSRTSV